MRAFARWVLKVSASRWAVVAAASLLIATLPAATAITYPAASNCNIPCTIKADKPVDLQLTGCTGGSLTLATFANKALNQNGASKCGGADFWTVAVGSNVYTTGELNGGLRTERGADGQSLVQTFRLNKFGEDVVLQANYTLVTNGTLVHYTVHNHGSAPVDVGFKYSWDLELNGNGDPKVFVDNRVGDGGGAEGTYGEHDVSFGPPSNDIAYVKVWQTRNGPDGENDLKQYFWFDDDWGGTAPDLIQYMDSGRAIQQANSFTFQPATNLISESEFQTYFGSPDLLHLAADDGVDGLGDDEREFILWTGTGIPDKLPAYGIRADFPARGAGSTFATQFIDAGESAQYLVRLAAIDLSAERALRYRLEPVAQQLPHGWSVQILDDRSGQPVSDVVLGAWHEAYFRLVVTAPKDAYGLDAARVLLHASLVDHVSGLYNKKQSVFDVTLVTTTILTPRYGLAIEGPAEVIPLVAGSSIELPVKVRNIGNLRTPFQVELDFASGCAALTKDATPQVFSLARGQLQDVTVRLAAAADAVGGEQSCVLRATEPNSQQSNKTTLRVRIVSDSDIAIIAEQSDLLLPPGAQATFKALVYNLGFDEVDLVLRGSANQVCTVVVGSSAGCQYADDAWTVRLDVDGQVVRLAPGGSQKVTVTVQAPADAKSGEQRAVLLAASKSGLAGTVAEELVRAVVQRVSVLAASAQPLAQAADPGGAMSFAVTLRNNGNAIEDLVVELAKLPAGWTATVVPDRFTLADGQQRDVKVTVTSPPGTLAGAYALQVLARNADQKHNAAVDLTATIRAVVGARLSTETPVVRILPTDTADVIFEVTNLGNAPDAFAISGIPTTWSVTVDPAVTPLLAPGASALVRLRGSLGGAVGEQTVPLVPVSLASGDATGAEPLPFTLIVSRPDLYIRSIRVLSPAGHVGDVEVVTAEVENLGGIEAKGVRVVLFVDGQRTGAAMDFDRLAPDRTLVASLPWSATAGEHAYRVEVDPDNLIDEGEGEGNNVAVLRSDGAAAQEVRVFGSDGRLADRFSPAGALPMVLLSLLGALFVALRRR